MQHELWEHHIGTWRHNTGWPVSSAQQPLLQRCSSVPSNQTQVLAACLVRCHIVSAVLGILRLLTLTERDACRLQCSAGCSARVLRMLGLFTRNLSPPARRCTCSALERFGSCNLGWSRLQLATATANATLSGAFGALTPTHISCYDVWDRRRRLCRGASA